MRNGIIIICMLFMLAAASAEFISLKPIRTRDDDGYIVLSDEAAPGGLSFTNDIVAWYLAYADDVNMTNGVYPNLQGNATLDGVQATASDRVTAITNAAGKYIGRFDGNNDYITVSDDDDLTITNGLTISVWLNKDNDDVLEGVVSKRNDGPGAPAEYSLVFVTTGPGVIRTHAYTAVEGDELLVDSEEEDTAGTWVNYMTIIEPGVTVDSISTFTNNVELSYSTRTTNGTYTGMVNTIADLGIGSLFGDDHGFEYDGDMGDVMIIKKALDSDERQEIIDAQTGDYYP